MSPQSVPLNSRSNLILRNCFKFDISDRNSLTDKALELEQDFVIAERIGDVEVVVLLVVIGDVVVVVDLVVIGDNGSEAGRNGIFFRILVVVVLLVVIGGVVVVVDLVVIGDNGSEAVRNGIFF